MNGRIQEKLHTQEDFDMNHLEMEKPMLSNDRVPEISGFPSETRPDYAIIGINGRHLRTNQCLLVVAIIFAS